MMPKSMPSLITMVISISFVLSNIMGCTIYGDLGEFSEEGICKQSVAENCFPSDDCTGSGV